MGFTTLVGKRQRVATAIATGRKQPDAFNNLSGGNCESQLR
jgi:hypothetical protein